MDSGGWDGSGRLLPVNCAHRGRFCRFCVLTARDTVSGGVAGLDAAAAADYLPPPSIRPLKSCWARMRALLRRTKKSDDSSESVAWTFAQILHPRFGTFVKSPRGQHGQIRPLPAPIRFWLEM